MKTSGVVKNDSEGKTSSKSSQLIIFFLSLIALIISLYSLLASRAFTRDADIIGIAVALLCGLVTLLIGWNIYNIIDIKGLRDQIDGYKKVAEDNSNKTIKQTSHYLSTTLLSIADLMGMQFKDSIKNNIGNSELFYKAIKYRLQAADVTVEKNDDYHNAIYSALHFLRESKNNNVIVAHEINKIDKLLETANAKSISSKTDAYKELIDLIKELKGWRSHYDERDYILKNYQKEAAIKAFTISIDLIPENQNIEKARLYLYRGAAWKQLSKDMDQEKKKDMLKKAESDINSGIELIHDIKYENDLAEGYSNLACIYAMLNERENFDSAVKKIYNLDTEEARNNGENLLHRRLEIYAKDYLKYI